MSDRARTKAWDDIAATPRMAPTTKIVYMALADVANDSHGYELWMAMGALAQKIGGHRTTVIESVAELVSLGFLAVVSEHAGKPTRYRMLVDGGVLKSDTHLSGSRTGGVLKSDTNQKEQELEPKPPPTPPRTDDGYQGDSEHGGVGGDAPLPKTLEAKAQREFKIATTQNNVRFPAALLATIRRRVLTENRDEAEHDRLRQRRLAAEEAEAERRRADAAMAAPMPSQLRHALAERRLPVAR